MLMFAMILGLVALILPFAGLGGFVYWLVLGDLVLVLIAFLLEFGTVLPILMKTMQGGPIHSSHMTNLIVALFYLIGLAITWADVISIGA